MEQDIPIRDKWISRNAAFEHLNEAEILEIDNNSNLVNYHKKDVIFKQNTRTSHILFIESGLVKIYKEGKSHKIISLKIIGQGHFVGLMAVFGDTLYQYSATAVEESKIRIIDHSVFLGILQNNGMFTLELMKLVSRDGLLLFNRLMTQSHKQLPGRIADVILYFSEQIYFSKKFEFPLTRQELAELAGTTKESFIRTINEFKHDKIIKLEGREVEIISMDIVKILSELG